MMINYMEKGNHLHQAIAEAGHFLMQQDGVWISSDDVAVQNIIDSFDPLPFAKADARTRLKKEAARRAAIIYPFISSDEEEAIGLYDFASDLYTAIIPAARETLSGRLLDFKAVFDVAQTTLGQINAQTDWEAVAAYDAVNTPNWP